MKHTHTGKKAKQERLPGVSDAFNRLSADKQELVYLTEMAGFSQKEAAMITGKKQREVQEKKEEALRELDQSVSREVNSHV